MEPQKSESGEPTQLGDDEALGLGLLLLVYLAAFIGAGKLIFWLVERYLK